MCACWPGELSHAVDARVCVGKRGAACGGGDARRKRVYGWRGGAASLRGADTAQVCNNVGFVAVDGVFECSFATAARQIVSERW